MTAKEVNRRVKKLAKDIDKKNSTMNSDYEEFIAGEAKKEFIRLADVDKYFEYMNRASILIMFRLNLRHRFVDFHTFGIHIELPLPRKQSK